MRPSLRILIPPWLQSQGGLAAMAGTTVWCRLSAVNGVWHAKEAPGQIIHSRSSTASLPLKKDDWKTILSFWGPVYFQGELLIKLPGSMSWIGGMAYTPKFHMEPKTKNPQNSEHSLWKKTSFSGFIRQTFGGVIWVGVDVSSIRPYTSKI